MRFRGKNLFPVLTALFAVSAMVAACNSSYRSNPPQNVFYFPISMTVHPNQNYAYIVSSNFDLGYKYGTLNVLDLVKLEEEIQADQAGTGCGGQPCYANFYSDAILASSTLMIGNFGGQVIYNPASSRLFFAQRQDSIVSWADVSADGSILDCKGSTNENPQDNPKSFIGSCHKSHITATGYNDPFDLSLGPNPVNPTDGCVYVGHLREGMITCLTANAAVPAPLYSADFSMGLAIAGVNDVEFVQSGRMFVANRSIYGEVNLLGAGDPSSLITNPTGGWMFDITNLMGVGQQKSLVLSQDGATLYLVTQGPDALIRFTVDNDPYGTPTLQAVDYAMVGVDPSRIFMLETDTPKRRLLYIPCVDSDYIHVIDGYTMEQVALLDFGFDAPYWMAFYDAPGGKRALVANFENSQVSVLSIDPVTLEHKLLANVGSPRVIEEGGY